MADEGIQEQSDPSPDMETTEARITEQERLATLADNVKQWVPATYLYGSLSLVHGKMLPAEAFIAYLEKFLEEAGGPTDPIERLLLEQLAFAHHNTGRLYIDAAAATTIEEARVLNGAVVKLVAEIRHTALAVKAYREPSAPRTTGNMTAAQPRSGRRQPSSKGQNGNGSRQKTNSKQSRSGKKTNGHANNRIAEYVQGSTSRRGRTESLAEAGTADA